MTRWLTFVALCLLVDTGPAAGQAFDAQAVPSPRGAADADADGDGLPDEWETQFGLSASTAAGVDGAAGDPDGDGITNLDEWQAGTHPRGFVTRYLAEGVTNAFFDTSLALLNPSATPAEPAHVLLRFLKSDGTRMGHYVSVPAGSRRTVRPATIAGMAAGDFSTVIESDALVIVDRTTSWGSTRYGSHSDTAVRSPSTTWYLAEGSTSSDFSLFYLLQNPNPSAVQATVRYLLPSGTPPIEKTYALPAQSRTTIVVDAEGGGLASTDVSAVITSDAPIIVERAMYKDQPGQPFAAGHDSVGVTEPAHTWFLAEGATGPFFDEFVLIANPAATAAEIAVDYLLMDGGLLTKTYAVPANSRFTIWVDDEELPAGSGQKPLANVAVSTKVRSTNGVPVIVERAMWWPGPEIAANFWYEAHNSPGATSTGIRWALAEGELGGPSSLETYILVANTSDAAGQARVTLLFEDGSSSQRTYDLAAHSRTNVNVGPDFPMAAGRTFGAVVDSIGNDPVEIVVERAMYSSAPQHVWSSGTNALAVVLEPSSGDLLDRTEGPSGTIVNVRGHGFTSMTVVMFGHVRVPASVVSDTDLRFVVPFDHSTSSVQPLAPADAVPVRVDGQVVKTFKVTTLPGTGKAPGEVLSATLSQLSQDWTAMRGDVVASLTRLRDARADDAVRAFVDGLLGLLPLVDSGYSQYLPAFAAGLDTQTLATLERALAHRGLGLAAHQSASVARSAQTLPATAVVDGNTFLEARRPFANAANDTEDAATLLDAVCALGAPTGVIPAACAASAGAVGVAGLLYDAAVSNIGTIEKFRIREGDRSGDDSGIRVRVQPATGTSIAASITIQRKWNPADPLILMLSRLVGVSKLGRVLPSEQIVIDKIEQLLQGYSVLKRLGWFDLSFGLPDEAEQELAPFDLRYVDIAAGASSQPFGLPAIRIEATGRVVPLVQDGFQDASFSLKLNVATNAESQKSYAGFFRVHDDSITGTWSGTYQYGPHCANWKGVETLELQEDANGNVTGTVEDVLLSPSVGVAGGTATGKHDRAAGTVSLSLFYTYGLASGPSQFKGTVRDDTMSGIGGNCGGGTSFTLTRGTHD